MSDWMLRRFLSWYRARGVISWIMVAAVGLLLGLLVARELGQSRAMSGLQSGDDWVFVLSDLVDSNDRLRNEIAGLDSQLDGLDGVEGAGALLEVLVAQVNQLRIANGQVPVSGEGVGASPNRDCSAIPRRRTVARVGGIGPRTLHKRVRQGR